MDAGTSTDAATLTEPEWLGPCEPGTAVNLEGIVWHETDAGELSRSSLSLSSALSSLSPSSSSSSSSSVSLLSSASLMDQSYEVFT